MFRSLQQTWQDIQLAKLRNFEIVIGKQWEKEDYDYLMKNRRSADVFNFILPVILALSGTQKVNRQKMRAYPVAGGDEDTAELITKVLRWSFDKCDKDFNTSRAFLDSVIARVGWMKSFWSTEWDPEGLWYTVWHDPLRIIHDSEAQFDFHRTCNYLFDSSWLPGEAIVNLYAANNNELAERMRTQLSILEGTAGTKATLSWRDKWQLLNNVARAAFGNERQLTEIVETEWFDMRNGVYRVIDLHERRRERHKYFMDYQTGKTVMIPDQVMDNHNLIAQMLERNPTLTVIQKYDSVIYISTMIPAFSADPIAAVPQDKPMDIQNGMYMFTPMTCYDFHPDILESRSLVDALRDPQAAYNKTESTIKDFIVRFVGHGWLIEQNSVDPDHLQEWESRMVGVNRFYKGGSTPPRADVPEQIPREVMVNRADHRESIRAISAVPLNYTGDAQTANEAASLFSQRVQQAGLIQSTYLDALHRMDGFLGKHAVDGLQRYLTAQREIRLLEDNEDPLWLVVNAPALEGIQNDITVGKYDVELDETTYSVTAKQESFMQGIALAKMMPPELIPWHLIIRNSDIANKREWLTFIESRMGVLSDPSTDPRMVNAVLQQLMMAGKAGAGGKPVATPGGGEPANRSLLLTQ